MNSWPEDCPFCRIVHGKAPATFVAGWPESVAIVPLNSVVPGHTLIIPRRHVHGPLVEPEITGQTFARAAEFAANLDSGHFNLIASQGKAASQTVFHLHVHVIPRWNDDGLALPWTGQIKSEV